jgi:hypothetical protein
VHEPFWQLSVAVHELPSLHEVPLVFGVNPQLPLLGLQVLSLHALPAQLFGLPAWHSPPEQVSPSVHGLPSSQAAVLFWTLQPTVVSQLSVVQGLPSLQVVGLPPPHAPEVQVSPVVHALASSQLLPSLTGIFTQPRFGSQLPALQESVRPEQSTMGVASQVPAWSPRH